MLKGISPIIGPDLLATLYRMGHGDEVVFADAHFPAESCNARVLRADGVTVLDLLEAIVPLFALDSYAAASMFMMAPVPGDQPATSLETAYLETAKRHWPFVESIAAVERYEFYEQTRKAYAVVATSDTAQYANLILKKGVTPVDDAS